MDALLLVALAGGALLIAYMTYGRWLSRRVFQLREDAATPACALRDDRDYCPTRKSIVFGHHFTSIAGTGPIVGPAIAVMWGWLPAILWVVFGAIFIGAVHDLGSLVVSMRNRGRSVGDIAGDLLGRRARLIFLAILIVGLWLVLAIFGLVIASVLRMYPAAIFPVLVQIPLAVVIGVTMHRAGRSIVLPSVIALVVMYASVIWGDAGWLHGFNMALAAQPIWLWTAGLLVYSYVASVIPVWTLLQPRDYINALQLITALGLLVVGLFVAATVGGPADEFVTGTQEASFATNRTVLGKGEKGSGTAVAEQGAIEPENDEGDSIQSMLTLRESMPPDDGTPDSATDTSHDSGSSPSSVNSHSRPKLSIVAPMIDWQPEGAPPMLPVLFITIACGACSGFHCLVGSGTTSKQIKRETDARAVGYGSMLTEGFLATLVIAACAAGIGLGVTRGFDQNWNHVIYANNVAGTKSLGLPDALHQMIAREAEEGWALGVTVYTDGSEVRWWSLHVPPDPGEDVDFGPMPPDAWLETSWGQIRVRPAAAPDDTKFELRGQAAFLKQYETWSSAGALGATVGAFVQGAANFIASLGISISVATALMAVLVASFAGTTMDTACRLQRYVVQELSRTFLPKMGRGACTKCGYDLSGLAGEKRLTTDESSMLTPRESLPPVPEALMPGCLDAASITCPECGAGQTAAEVTASDHRASVAAASIFNPFRWLVTIHGATLFAIITAFALAMWPWPDAQTVAQTLSLNVMAPANASWLGSLPIIGPLLEPTPGANWLDYAQTWLINGGKGGLILWPLFGATNQLLAGFAFIVITAWLIATNRPKWFIVPAAIFMLAVPASAMIWQAYIGNEANPSWVDQDRWLLVSIATVTLVLEAWLLIETATHWIGRKRR